MTGTAVARVHEEEHRGGGQSISGWSEKVADRSEKSSEPAYQQRDRLARGTLRPERPARNFHRPLLSLDVGRSRRNLAAAQVDQADVVVGVLEHHRVVP